MFPFDSPKNIRKPIGFVIFSGGVKKEHWMERVNTLTNIDNIKFGIWYYSKIFISNWKNNIVNKCWNNYGSFTNVYH